MIRPNPQFLILIALLATSAVAAPSTAPSPPATSPEGGGVLEKAWQRGMQALRRDVLRAPFTAELTIGQAVERLNLGDKMDQSIQTAEQPGGPRWRDSTCEVRMELPGTVVATVLGQVPEGGAEKLGLTKEAFERKLAYLRTLQFSAIGVSQPADNRAVLAVQPAMPAGLIPRDPPEWVNRQMDADGEASGRGLKAARAAEALALAQLRQQTEALKLHSEMTLAQAAAKDPRIGNALATAIRRAHVVRVEYGEEIVAVRVNLDLDYVWQALAALD